MTTAYMGMDLPIVGTTAGPLWATKVNTALTDKVDLHDHTSGKGTRVPTLGILINADLEFNGYDATELRSTRYEQQASVAASDDVACCYVLSSTGDLYYRNAAGTEIRLTSGGAVNAAGLSANTYPGAAKVANYAILPADTQTLFHFNTTGATRTATLPSAAAISAGRFYLIGSSTGANGVIIAADGTDTINGAASITVRGWGAAYVVRVSSTTWLALEVGPQLNGATVPEAGGLTTGNVLQVSGSAALTYAALNLAGGSNYVTGVLPAANLASATTLAQGAVVLAQDLSGTSSAPTVVAITGNTNRLVIRDTAKTIRWDSTTVTPTITQADESTAATTGDNMTIRAQAATDEEGGTLVLEGGDSKAGIVKGGVKLNIGGSETLVSVDEVASGRAVVSVGGAATSTSVPTGDRLLWLANCDTTPSSNPVGGVELYADAGAFAFRGTSGHRVRFDAMANTVTGLGGGAITTTGTCAKCLVVTVEGTQYVIPLYTLASYT